LVCPTAFKLKAANKKVTIYFMVNEFFTSYINKNECCMYVCM
jgi:hypothetical protein